jgi:hypothetical protein
MPSKRISCENMLKHPFFSDIDPLYLNESILKSSLKINHMKSNNLDDQL